MSLINNMLKNLEKRPLTFLLPEKKAFSSSSMTLSTEFHKNKVYYYAISILSIFLMASLLFFPFKKYRNHAGIETHQASEKNTVDSNNTIMQPLTYAAMLTAIAMQVQPDNTNFRFLLNSNTLYRISQDIKSNSLIITFEHTSLLAALPKMNFVGSGIENIQAFNDQFGNLKLVLKLNPQTEIKHLELSEGKSPELQLDLTHKNGEFAQAVLSDKNKTIPLIMKKPIVESTTELQFQNAVKLSSTGHTEEAAQTLRDLLTIYPGYNQGRELLATLLLQQNNRETATKIIDAGLQLDPAYPPFAELKARILVDQGNIAEAVNLLKSSPPAIEDNPEYHAFLAALYQRTGNTKLAVNLYKQLVSLEPSNGKWWIGLGIALEEQGNRTQAEEAYAQADETNNLAPELRAYLDTRLHSG